MKHLKFIEVTMAFLNRNNIVPYVLFFLVCGCATSSFELLNQHGNAVELKVTPDRVLLECEPQPGHEIEEAHGFLMYILDDQNTVITLARPNVLDKKECFDGLRKIGKILKTGKIIYTGGIGDLTKPKAKNDRKHIFPSLGVFPSNGKSLKFMVIANEHGLCFDAHDGDKGPCPREPFSLKNLK